MKIHYLEVVTDDVESTCAHYAHIFGVTFGEADQGLGNACTALCRYGGMIGVRAPLSDSEKPMVRPYWLVDDIELAYQTALDAGAEVAHPPKKINGLGTFAIYILGGNQHGLWQK